MVESDCKSNLEVEIAASDEIMELACVDESAARDERLR
jgi:hypothetical protein